MLEAGQQHVAARVQVVLGLDDGRHRAAQVGAEELQAQRTDVLRHAVQHEHRRGDQAVAALLLDAGQAAEELVGDVLAQALLAQGRTRQPQELRLTDAGAAVARVACHAEARRVLLVDLAQVVAEALHLQPVGVGRDHAPGHQVVQRRAPQHRLLAAGVHGHVAADGRGVLRGGIDREGVVGRLRALGDAAGDHAGAGTHGGDLAVHALQAAQLHRAQRVQLLGVDHRAVARQRHGAAGVAGAAAARDDGQPELDAGRDHRADLLLGIRTDDHEGHLDAPVGGVGGVRDARQAAEVDVVGARHPSQAAAHRAAQLTGARKPCLEAPHRRACRVGQPQGELVALGARDDLIQAVVQRVRQRGPALRIVEQVVLDVRVAVDDPHVAQHLEQHARRAARPTRAAQPVQHVPHLRPEIADHDLAVGEGGVVVGDLADPGGLGHRGRSGHGVGRRSGRAILPPAGARDGPRNTWKISRRNPATENTGKTLLPRNPRNPRKVFSVNPPIQLSWI